jgi:hypothetical protein
MTNDEKAKRYEDLVREGDRVSNQISKLKSSNINGNTPEEERQLAELNNKMAYLQSEMTKLMNS